MVQKVVLSFDIHANEAELKLAEQFKEDMDKLGVEVELIGSRPKDRG